LGSVHIQFLSVGLSQTWVVDCPLTPVKLPEEEKPTSISRNCRAEAGEKDTAVLSSVETTHWFQPAVELVMAEGPIGQVTVEGNWKGA